MNNYLNANELAALVGCRPNSYACMKRWLTRNGWPFVTSISGFPTVSRASHDALMAGATPQVAKAKARAEPNFAALA